MIVASMEIAPALLEWSYGFCSCHMMLKPNWNNSIIDVNVFWGEVVRRHGANSSIPQNICNYAVNVKFAFPPPPSAVIFTIYCWQFPNFLSFQSTRASDICHKATIFLRFSESSPLTTQFAMCMNLVIWWSWGENGTFSSSGSFHPLTRQCP